MELRALIDAKLAQRFTLNKIQCEQFVQYYELLIDWNTRMNLTAITEPEAVVEKHFFDSLLLLEDVTIREGERLIDVGTGAGFPGIPLAIACPELQVDLLDSLRKRVGFLQVVIDELNLANVRAYHDRAELFAKKADYRDQYDWAVARAVARLPLLCEYCLPFVREGGIFIACKGPNGAVELEEAQGALKQLNAMHQKTCQHHLENGDARDILLIKKIGATPKRFPRQPGMAAKSPIR